MASATPLADALRDIVDYINVSVANGAITTQVARHMITDTLSSVGHVSIQEATRCMVTLQSAALFSAADKASFAAVVNAKVVHAPLNAAADRQATLATKSGQGFGPITPPVGTCWQRLKVQHFYYADDNRIRSLM
jgi:hypothetical protein